MPWVVNKSLTQAKLLPKPIKIAFLLCLGLIPMAAFGAMASVPPPEDFGRYLIDHREDLAPFFSRNGSDLTRGLVPLAVEWMGGVFFLTLILGWAIDVLLARGFATLFVPPQTSFRPALIYATGRVGLNLILVAAFGLGLIGVAGAAHLALAVVAVVVVFVFLATAVQVGWIWYLYRSDVRLAVLFYLTVVVVHDSSPSRFQPRWPTPGRAAPPSPTWTTW